MSQFVLSRKSQKKLEGVDDRLVAVVERAIQITPVDFLVIEGLRTPQRQRELYRAGKTWTKNSKHLTGHAVDLAPLFDGQIPWRNAIAFAQVALAMDTAARELDTAIRWGGDWNQNGSYRDEIKRGVFDGAHFELTGGSV